jgi:hypothetical protein
MSKEAYLGGARREKKEKEKGKRERERDEKGKKRPNQAQCMRKKKGQPIQTKKPIDPFCVSNTKFLSNVALSNEGRHVWDHCKLSS